MCFYTKLDASAAAIAQRFQATISDNLTVEIAEITNGFTHPTTPIISNDAPKSIQSARWGLLPHWADAATFKANTLNARIETLNDKPTFRPYINNRCLIIADAFYEWQWIDPKGKTKQPYLISLESEAIFAFAGIYSDVVDTPTGEVLRTYSIITTTANELMHQIHNTKHRMPIILTPENEMQWLEGAPYLNFSKPNVHLIAKAIR